MNKLQFQKTYQWKNFERNCFTLRVRHIKNVNHRLEMRQLDIVGIRCQHHFVFLSSYWFIFEN